MMRSMGDVVSRSRSGRKVAVIALAMLFAGLIVGASRRPPPPSTLGAYHVEIRGALVGRGVVIVSAAAVNVQALVRDSNGNSGNLVAAAVPLDSGRFDGSGALAGLPVRVMGRVDPPSEVVPVARVTFMVTTATDQSARGIGAKR